MASTIDLNIVQGSDFFVSIVAADDLGEVIDLTQHTVGGYAKHRYGDETPFFDFKPVIGSDPKTGEINLILSPEDTSKIPAGQYFYGIEVLSGDSVGFKVMNGAVNVIPEVNK